LKQAKCEHGDVLDSQVLQSLPGDALMLQKILHLFLRSSEALIVSMEVGVESSDMAQVADAAHTLKSSSAMVGAMELSERCQMIEVIIKDDDLSELTGVVQQARRARQLVEGECQNRYLKP